MKIFLTTSNRDSDIASEVAQGLITSGHEIFLATELVTPPGPDFHERIMDQLLQSDALTVTV